MSLRRIVAGVGRTLISIGVLLLLFVAYQLWGTGLATNRLQDKASQEFAAQLAAMATDPAASSADAVATDTALDSAAIEVPSTVANAPLVVESTLAANVAVSPAPRATVPAATTSTRPAATTSTLPKVRAGRTQMQRPKQGKVLGRIVIKRIKLDYALIEGSDKESLKTGPGHYSSTPMPGQPGNVAIACHRTTYGAPCFNLHLLKVGDEILLQTLQGTFKYAMVKEWLVPPKGPVASAALAPTPGENVLTMTTCHPQYSAAQRLVMRAKLIGPAAAEDFFEPLPIEPVPTASVAPTTSAPATVVMPGDDPLVVGDIATTTVVPTTNAEPTDAEQTDADVVDVVDASASPATSTDTGPASDTGPTIEGQTVSGSGPIRSLFWFRGHQSVWVATLLLGLLCALIWLGAWLVARKRKFAARAFIYTVGFVCLFGPALFFFYEQLAKLLPESV